MVGQDRDSAFARTLVSCLRIVFLAAICASASWTAATPSASAEPVTREMERAEALATEAKAYFKGKLYEQAAAKFLEAFAVARRPALVFNAARAYEEGKKPRRAVAIFEMYAGLTESSTAGKADAKRRIAALKKSIAAAEGAQTRKQKLASKPPPSPIKVAPTTVKAPAPPEPDFPLWRTAAGGVLTAFALGAWLNANSLSTEMASQDVRNQTDMARYLSLADDARLWQGIAIGSAIAGVSLLAWGQADYWWLQRRDKTSALRVLPTIRRDGIAWSIQGSF